MRRNVLRAASRLTRGTAFLYPFDHLPAQGPTMKTANVSRREFLASTKQDRADIAEAIEKIYEHRDKLA